MKALLHQQKMSCLGLNQMLMFEQVLMKGDLVVCEADETMQAERCLVC